MARLQASGQDLPVTRRHESQVSSNKVKLNKKENMVEGSLESKIIKLVVPVLRQDFNLQHCKLQTGSL